LVATGENAIPGEAVFHEIESRARLGLGHARD
jgi:hypothetical protein